MFRDRAATAYAAAGIATETLADAESARESNIAALLTIRHEERETSAELEQGRMTEPAIVARTEVTSGARWRHEADLVGLVRISRSAVGAPRRRLDSVQSWIALELLG